MVLLVVVPKGTMERTICRLEFLAKWVSILLFCCLCITNAHSTAFVSYPSSPSARSTRNSVLNPFSLFSISDRSLLRECKSGVECNHPDSQNVNDGQSVHSRRNVLSDMISAGGMLLYTSSADVVMAAADDVNESFASIAERANKMSREMDTINPQTRRLSDSLLRPTNQTIYDFTLPISSVATPFAEIVRQEFNTKKVTLASKNETLSFQDAKVKAIIVVNIKQDDPVARKTIPELIALAAKYGRGSDYELAIVACPTDQGYYEPDTSQLLRLKVASEYGYGINPSTVVTDKVNLLGTGAVPLWRWLQNVCRAPNGLGRIQGNFEKFLIDGRTGLPVRRYPRKYRPLNMMEDIEAVIAGRPLPPAQAGYLEEWRMATADAERDTYRFEKGLNVFDQ
jgi:glutathione peroxidase-family protein